MTITYKFFHDSSLTQEITALDPLTATQETSGALGPVDKTVYLGSVASGNKAEASSDPGVDPIVVSVVDTASGSGAPASEIKLALSSGGLSTAVAGAALTLATEILSGVGNAVPIYVRRASALTVPGAYTDIQLQTNNLNEGPV